MGIIAAILILGIIILIHELGHFIFAKKADILCHEFSIGMGPVLWSKRKGETVYSIRAIPIGGYVSMAGEELVKDLFTVDQAIWISLENDKVKYISLKEVINDKYIKVKVLDYDLYGENGELFIKYINDANGEIEEKFVLENAMHVDGLKQMQITPFNRSFESKSKLQRFLAIFAGPLMNFVLAIVLYFIVGLFVGTPVVDSNKIGEIQEDYPAYIAGILPGDEIVAIDGVDINNWNDILNSLSVIDDRNIEIVVNRNGEEITYNIVPHIQIFSIGISSDDSILDKVIIGQIVEGTLAESAGIIEGDEIIAIDDVNVTSWLDVIDIMDQNIEGNPISITISRDGVLEDIEIWPYSLDILETQDVGLTYTSIGISPEYEFSLISAIQLSYRGVYNSLDSVFKTLGLLFNNDRIGIKDLAGPVGIVNMTSEVAKAGLISLLSFAAFISVNIGFINLLPIPALDGGRLVFLLTEIVTRKRVDRKLENMLHTIMFMLLMGLFVFVTFNDILRLIGLK